MRHEGRRIVVVLGIAAALVLALAEPHAARGDQDPNLSCRSAIQAGLRRWFTGTLRARQECRSRTILGRQDPQVDCVAGSNDPDLAARLARLDARLDRVVTRRCGQAEWGLLSYPGPCHEVAGPEFAADDLLRCVKAATAAVIDALFQIEYPPVLEAGTVASHSDEAACIVGAAERSSAMLSGDMRTRFRCQLLQEAGDIDAAVDCRAIPVPYGAGTGDAAIDAGIWRSYLALLSGFPRACALADTDALGYGENCPDFTGASFDFRDLKSCVFDANQIQLAILMNVVFPSDPVCGNSILQEGEECDDGRFNSDTTPGACRKNCRLPFCGDATTDPDNAETCDDGNTDGADGCNAQCVTEVCGDGAVNGSPHEECDDGNDNAADGCTNACRVATCGDGAACTDPACESGPGGGPEECDDGVDNAADAACHADCSGFRFTCAVTIGVTSSETLGALLYEVDYGVVAGEFLGTTTSVRCTSVVSGALFTFRDEEAHRTLRESVIKSAGFTGPISLATCSFATSNGALAAQAFNLTVLDASSPDFDPLTPTVAVTAVDCSGQ